MSREGQHTMRLAVKGDSRSADKELANLAKREAELERSLARANRELVKHASAHTNAGNAAANSAQRMQQAARAQAQAQVDSSRRQREALSATSTVRRSNVKQHIAAIEREKVAKLQQIAVEQRYARTVADSYRLQNQADATRHAARMQRIRVERAAQTQAAQASQARTAALGKFAGGATVAAVAADRLADRTFKLQNVQANLPFSIDKARDATKGLVSDFDLMQQAIQANRLGVAKTSDEFAKAAETAVTLSVAAGTDATQGLRDFTNGLGRGSTEVLDNLGIMLRASEAHKEYAESIGTTASKLTGAQKRQAVINVGLERGADLAAKSTVQVDGWAASWERAKISLSNTADEVVQLDKNVKELSVETLKTLGVSGPEAVSRTESAMAAGAKGAKDFALNVLTLGQYTSFATEEVAEGTEKVERSIKRGQPQFSLFRMWLVETGSAAERTEKTLDKLGTALVGIGEQAAFRERQSAAFAEQEFRDEEDRARIQRRDKLEAGLAKEEKRKSKSRKKNIDAHRAALEAEQQLTIDAARREREIGEQAYGEREETASNVISLVQAQADAERDLALMQSRWASSRAERLQAQGQLEGIEHQARMDRISIEKHERRTLLDIERKAIESHKAFARAEASTGLNRLGRGNAEEMGALDLERAQQLRASEQDPSLQRTFALAKVQDQVAFNEELREAQLEQVEWEIEQTDDRLERSRLEDQADQIKHESKLDRIKLAQAVEANYLAVEQANTRKRMQMRNAVLQQATSFGQGMANVTAGMIRTEREAVRAAREAGESESKAKAKTRGQNLKALSAQLTGQAIAHGAQAIGAVASFNYAGAALHTAAAASLGVAAGIIAVRGDELLARGGGGGGVSGGGSTAPSFGGGGSSATSGSANTGSIPPSPSPGSTPQPGNPAGGAANGPPQPAGGGRTVNINAEFNAVSIDRAAAREIRDHLDDLAAQEAS